MRKLRWLLLSVTFCYCASCAKKKCEYTDDGMVAPVSEQQAVKKYLDSLGIAATLHSRGFYYKINDAGSGLKPAECSQITIGYIGQLTNGTIFDQQNSFATQLVNLIDGWQQGVPLIQKGGEITLYIPPTLGYGSQSVSTANPNITIPPYSILIFDIHLLDVQ
ncbi:MAG TPA: FKBP-type peptidyl-prolyl cis-trans isomerase [Puia sp.]|nr:FKBP-type peptidyl-prolyl cis-trans isomerase [Puia sp.]